MDNQHRLIAGYRDLTESDIARVNEIKAKAEEVGALVDKLAESGVDMRWLNIGKTGLQQGFMALTRAVTQPGTF